MGQFSISANTLPYAPRIVANLASVASTSAGFSTRLNTGCCRRCIFDPHTGISLTLLQTPNSLLHFAFQTAGLGQHSVGTQVNNASVATCSDTFLTTALVCWALVDTWRLWAVTRRRYSASPGNSVTRFSKSPNSSSAQPSDELSRTQVTALW